MEHRIYTSPDFLEGEANALTTMLALGLPFLHLRKPKSNIKHSRALLANIDARYHHKIILHQHWELIEEFALGGLHWTEGRRATETPSNFARHVAVQQKKGWIVGTSIHQPEQLLEMPPSLDYVTVSPIFESISKPEHLAKYEWHDTQEHPFLLVALGGVAPSTLSKAQVRGFRSVGLLGAIWKEPQQAVQNYKELCQVLKQLDPTP